MSIDGGSELVPKDLLRKAEAPGKLGESSVQILAAAGRQMDIDTLNRKFDEIRAPYRGRISEAIPGMAGYDEAAILAVPGVMRNRPASEIIGLYETAKKIKGVDTTGEASCLAAIAVASGRDIQTVGDYYRRLGMKETWGGKGIYGAEAVLTLTSLMAVDGDMVTTMNMFDDVRKAKISDEDTVSAILAQAYFISGDLSDVEQAYRGLHKTVKAGFLGLDASEEAYAVLTVAAALRGGVDEVEAGMTKYRNGRDKVDFQSAARAVLGDACREKGVVFAVKNETHHYGKVVHTTAESLYLGKI